MHFLRNHIESCYFFPSPLLGAYSEVPSLKNTLLYLFLHLQQKRENLFSLTVTRAKVGAGGFNPSSCCTVSRSIASKSTALSSRSAGLRSCLLVIAVEEFATEVELLLWYPWLLYCPLIVFFISSRSINFRGDRMKLRDTLNILSFEDLQEGFLAASILDVASA